MGRWSSKMLLAIIGTLAIPQALLVPIMMRLVVTLNPVEARAYGIAAFVVILADVVTMAAVPGFATLRWLAVRFILLNVMGAAGVFSIAVAIRHHLWWALGSGALVIYVTMMISLWFF